MRRFILTCLYVGILPLVFTGSCQLSKDYQQKCQRKRDVIAKTWTTQDRLDAIKSPDAAMMGVRK